MIPTLAARAGHSPATITSPAAVASGDREQRRAKKLGMGRRISADFSVGQGHTRRVSADPVRRISGAAVAASERTPLLAPPAPSAGAGLPPTGASYASVVRGAGTGGDNECHSDALAVRRASAVSTKGRFHGLPGMDKAPTVWNEFRVLVKSSLPLSAGLMLENALNTINILVCGRLGASELAVAGNSSLLIMVTGESLEWVGELG